MNKETKETKEKIIEHALKLFSVKGFNGTSVRDIASSADVNIAAINYHFQSKANLFSHLAIKVYQEMNQEIESLESLKEWNTQDFSLAIFTRMLKQEKSMALNFRALLTDQEIGLDDSFYDAENTCGPPGGHCLAKVIQRERPKAHQNDVIWAVRVIFTHIAHSTLMRSTPFAKGQKFQETFSPEQLTKELKRLIKITLQEI